jgi:hypothetical protein
MSKKNKSSYLKIPDSQDWLGYESDLDVAYLHKLIFGKSIQEAIPHFANQAIARMDELLFAPRRVFQYYVFSFGEYLMLESAAGESDAASPFLALLEEREKRDPRSVKNIIEPLQPYLEFVATRQEYFDAPEDIYGNFNKRVADIRRACHG